MKTDYPIGARWEAEGFNGKVHFVELISRNEHHEHWTYGSYHSDGSGFKFDWHPSFRKAKEYSYAKGRFKRVK